jgi:CheY-like chemotaxis protein
MSAPASSTNNVVLLVEDDEDIRVSTAESLEDEGFAVIGAEGVDEGLAHLRSGPSPAVILLDLMMPGRNGWDFRQDQLADPELREIPVVVITASGIGAESLRRDMGDVQLVAKPFSCESLLRAIVRALAHAAG